eukprot:ANDGO_01599.mRNA.1 Equilibrative nucleotide transporter 1
MRSTESAQCHPNVFYLIGVATLLGWNALLSSLDYLLLAFPSVHDPLLWLTASFELANIIFTFVICAIGTRLSFRARFVGGFGFYIVYFIAVPILVDVFVLPETLGFSILVALTFVLGAANAVAEASLYGLAHVAASILHSSKCNAAENMDHHDLDHEHVHRNGQTAPGEVEMQENRASSADIVPEEVLSDEGVAESESATADATVDASASCQKSSHAPVQKAHAGQSMSGLLVSSLRVLTKASFEGSASGSSGSTIQQSAYLYFALAIVPCIVCIVLFYKYLPLVGISKPNLDFVSKRGTDASDISESTRQSMLDRLKPLLIPMQHAYRSVRLLAWSIVIQFTFTLAMFPGLVVSLPSTPDSWLANNGWLPTLLIFTFNIGDYAGRELGGLEVWDRIWHGVLSLCKGRGFSLGFKHMDSEDLWSSDASPQVSKGESRHDRMLVFSVVVRGVILFPLLIVGIHGGAVDAVGNTYSFAVVLLLGLSNGWISVKCFIGAQGRGLRYARTHLSKTEEPGVSDMLEEMVGYWMVGGLIFGVTLGVLLAIPVHYMVFPNSAT